MGTGGVGGHIQKQMRRRAAGVFLRTITGRRKVIRLRLALKSHRKGKQNGSWAMAGIVPKVH